MNGEVNEVSRNIFNAKNSFNHFLFKLNCAESIYLIQIVNFDDLRRQSKGGPPTSHENAPREFVMFFANREVEIL